MVYKPKFNPMYLYHFITKNELRVGITPDKLFEIIDETGSIHRLITLMDGKKSVAEIANIIRNEFSEISLEEVEIAIQDFNEMGFLIHSDKDQHDLNERELERFTGNINYISHFCPPNQDPALFQQKISNSKVTIIGMGAFGSSLLINLAGLGVKNVKIIDFDTVSLSNLNRQLLFNEKDIGRPKIIAAKEFMKLFYSDMNIETFDLEIRDSLSIEQIIKDSDLVILAADQPYLLLPRWVNEACVKLNIPFIAGSINIKMGMLYTIIPHVSGCVDCMHLNNWKESDNYYSKVNHFLDLNFIPANMATAPNLMMITGMISSEIFKQLTGLNEPKSAGKMIMFDFETFESSILTEWEIDKECPTCGSSGQLNPLFQLFNQKEYSMRRVVMR
ncbi:HesA/MoeB/ThiF family protein [Bacillus sp. FJAT-18017]|uniref:HesA/MoeB/ThiF family protein n=1 Tax=Bacillus sp. FJAT-18017 TaxID=1705566 RepID=UPI0006B02F38|nr:ThiF family adenylyltransferase [Bacillus sp. FJAT-18017]